MIKLAELELKGLYKVTVHDGCRRTRVIDLVLSHHFLDLEYGLVLGVRADQSFKQLQRFGLLLMQSFVLVVGDRLVRVHVLEFTLVVADLFVCYSVHNLSWKLDLSSEFSLQLPLLGIERLSIEAVI